MAVIEDLQKRNEDALDLFADLLEPAAEIFADPEVQKAFRSGSTAKAVKPAIKNHKKAVIEILARLHGEEPETYKVNALMIPLEAVRLINKPEVQDFLSSLSQETEDGGSSGSPTENTEAEGQ